MIREEFINPNPTRSQSYTGDRSPNLHKLPAISPIVEGKTTVRYFSEPLPTSEPLNSTMEARTTRKLEPLGSVSTTTKNIAREPEKRSPIIQAKHFSILPLVGGTMMCRRQLRALRSHHHDSTQYRALYSGVKTFWRNQKLIHFDFYHHIDVRAIEIIPFDPITNKELNRIYLDLSIILESLHQQEDTTEDMKYEFQSEDKVQKLEDKVAERSRIVSHILARLQQDDKHGVLYASLVNDVYSAILTKPPSILHPIKLTRRRRSTGEEIDATITALLLPLPLPLSFPHQLFPHSLPLPLPLHLHNETLALKDSTSVCTSRDITSAINAINSTHESAIESRNKKIDISRCMENKNPVRKRWIQAIDSVLHIQDEKKIMDRWIQIYADDVSMKRIHNSLLDSPSAGASSERHQQWVQIYSSKASRDASKTSRI